MHHYTVAPRHLRPGKYLPWLLCQAHFEALGADIQQLYIGCCRTDGICTVRQDDCARCEVVA